MPALLGVCLGLESTQVRQRHGKHSGAPADLLCAPSRLSLVQGSSLPAPPAAEPRREGVSELGLPGESGPRRERAGTRGAALPGQLRLPEPAEP